ncbi:restriction endonuclease subunit S [Staphylococcus cohnii]|uniref:restriction endonuclease subunit S n=1 Tax=Staphylococcus cohnii TaxID=29382 RepID=UPI0005890B66|nr:restriction endonuclease subunit S [Staphylococcus cohnii]
MTNEIKNVPELRFPEFSSEWEENQLSKLTQLLKDGTHGTHKDVENGAWLLSAKNIKNNNIIFDESDRKISYDDYHKIYKNYQLQKNDLLLSIVGTIGHTALVKDPINLAFQRSVAIIRFENRLSNLFFLYLFQTHTFKKKLLRNQVVSAQPGLYLGDLGKFFVNYPLNYKEQEKIGTFFNKLDQQIELEEQKLEKLEEQKKGYMQKIFSQELRFKDENGNDYPEWEDKLISDIGKVVTGNTPSKKDNDYWNSNQYVWVTPTDISNKKNIYTSGYQLSQKGFSKARQLPKNTLLITCIASIGKNAILRIEGSCNQQINAVIPNDNYDVDYLYYAFEDVSKLMKSIAGKTATQIVNKAVFEKLLLNVPIYEEQQKISGFLNKVDILIDKQTQKIDELKLRKQGFLQKMFV